MKDFDIVDFHAHILPCADHGSNSVETSLKQLKYASLYGVKRIVATPHFYPHRHTLNSFLKRRDGAYIDLTKHLTDGMPEIRLGAEVLICDNIDRFSGLEKLCISGTNILLLELPFTDFTDNFCISVENLCLMGYRVVLAHADRYQADDIEKLVSSGAKIQLNADSVTTFFKKKHLYNWAERGLVVALGSDIHNANKSAYKKFDKAKEKFADYLDVIKESSDKFWADSNTVSIF